MLEKNEIKADGTTLCTNVGNAQLIQKKRGRPKKHPIQAPKCKIERTSTGCMTCRRRKKKCDEKKPECKLILTSANLN